MRSSYPLIINIRIFLCAQPNSRKISYDSIRKWKRFGFSRIRVLNHSRHPARYPHGKSAAGLFLSRFRRAHVPKIRKRAQVRAVNADINVTVPCIIFGADSKRQLVAISTPAGCAPSCNFLSPLPFNSFHHWKAEREKNPIQIYPRRLLISRRKSSSPSASTVRATGNYYFPFERRERVGVFNQRRCISTSFLYRRRRRGK